MRRLLATLSLIATAPTTLAADHWHTSTIRWVYPYANGSFALAFHTEHASCASVSTPKYYVVAANQNGVTAEAANRIYAAALTALAARNTVQIDFSDSSTSCFVNRLILTDE